MTMPPVGVQVTTSPPASVSGAPIGDIRTYFVAGQCHRGDTTAPIIISSFAQAQDLIGDRVSYGALYDDIQTFFGELAGIPGRVVVARVVGPAAVKATLTLLDGSGVATLALDAKDEGLWGNSVSIVSSVGSVVNTFTLAVSYKGALRETFTNLATPADAVSALASSGYIRGRNLGSVTAAPGNNPIALASTGLAAGASDTTSVTAAMLIGALTRFNSDLGPGLVAIPSQPYTTVATGLALHCIATSRISVTAPAAGTSVVAAGTAARSLRASTGAEYQGFFYPWVQIPDGAGGVRTISPEGFIAGRRGATIDAAGSAGPSQPPAGVAGIARFIVGLEKSLTSDEINTLNADAVNSVRLYAGNPRLYGWRSLSLDDANYHSLTTRDLLNHVSFKAGQVLENYVERTIDSKGQVFVQIGNDLTAVLVPIADAGGLYARPNGTPPDPGFLVDVGPSVNTDASIARGEIRAVMAIRDSPAAELIRATLVKVPLTADF
jgi:hypothetical protein